MFGKTEKVKVLVLDGQGIVRRIRIGLKFEKEGDFLKNSMINSAIPITNAPVLFQEGKKTKMGYIIDISKGCTCDIEQDQSIVALKTNSELIASVVDSRLIQDAFSLRPYKGALFASAILGIGIGIVIGLMF